MKRLFNLSAVFAALVLCLAIAPRTEAQQAGPGPGPLTTLVNSKLYSAYFGQVERSMAASLDAASNDIAPFCGDGCAPRSLSSLNDRLFELNFAAANLGQLSPAAALAVVQQIAIALRGIAPEELSAQRTASNEFASDQRDQIRSRLEAVRKGAQGFAVNGFSNGFSHHSRVAQNTSPLIGGASADALPTDFSRWGGFLNGTYTRGDRDATDLEDAFRISGRDLALGVDFRLSYHSVIGVMLSDTRRGLTFDSSQSASAGRIDSNGHAIVLYASYEWDGPYLSASIGRQRLSNDLQRNIHYDIPSVVTPTDAINTGSTDSTASTFTLDGGWMMRRGAFGYEPLVRVLYRDTKFDAFTESSVDLSGTPTGLGLTIGERSTKTLNASLGMKLSYALKPSFGALVPYFQGEYRHEFKTDAMQSRADFSDLVSASVTPPTSTLTLHSDRPDASYYVVEAGAAAVFKHGIQGFLNARSVFGLENAKLYVVSLGIRGEF